MIDLALALRENLSRQNSPSREPAPMPFLFSYQREPFCELLRNARAFANTHQWNDLPVQPRWHSLVIGPTGTGKSHLAKSLSRTLGRPLLALTTSNWILLGCSDRGGRQTWRQIAQWLVGHDSNTILFLDEIDKVAGSDTWSRHLQSEVFDLLDGRIPPEIIVPEGDANSPALDEDLLCTRLRSNTFIVSAAAFQEIWSERSSKIAGFGAESLSPPPSLRELHKFLPQELLNRFSSRLIPLRQLRRPDYEEMLAEVALRLPAQLRCPFLDLGHQRLEIALEDQKGSRFPEEILSETLALLPPPPLPASSPLLP